MSYIKEIRKEKKLTQQQVADIIGMSLRSYKSYENDTNKEGSLKYRYIVDMLVRINPIDETHGVLSIDDITEKCSKIFTEYDIEYGILFGSYAKNIAREDSDVDLLISAGVNGMKFFELVEKLRCTLHKRIDLLDVSQLRNNLELTDEILKDGIRIYGKHQE